jgi:RNA ligase (TIGR02306 family)
MRKLATIRKINDIKSIPNADAIEVATVDGWQVVVKRGEYKIGDLAIYCEIDSWIPNSIASFLSKGKEPRVYQNIAGERLRTVKLRGQISQGLLLPCNIIPRQVELGEDVSEELNINKWEMEIPAQLRGTVRGSFPSFIPKTDQERIQNLVHELEQWKGSNELWEITEKLDGSSMTVYVNQGYDGVCSRNLDLKRDDNNSFWKVAIQERIHDRIREVFGSRNIALQGELIGLGVQGNKYNLQELKFYLFDIFDIDRQIYISARERHDFCFYMALNHVPVMTVRSLDKDVTVASLLKLAEGPSFLNLRVEKEGYVYKNIRDSKISFKTISNKFLLGEK